jgi:hypothetical protein
MHSLARRGTLLVTLALFGCAATGSLAGGAAGASGTVRAQPASSARSSAVSSAIPAASTVACEASRLEAPAGTRRVDDPALLALAVGPPDGGKLCAGVVFETERPLTVYRVWQRDRPTSERGRWWTLERPTGSRAEYRAANVICPEWSALDALTRCELRAGARFVLGPGQSTRCADGSRLEGNAHPQVFIDNDARVGRVHVERCEPLDALP